MSLVHMFSAFRSCLLRSFVVLHAQSVGRVGISLWIVLAGGRRYIDVLIVAHCPFGPSLFLSWSSQLLNLKALNAILIKMYRNPTGARYKPVVPETTCIRRPAHLQLKRIRCTRWLWGMSGAELFWNPLDLLAVLLAHALIPIANWILSARDGS